MREGGREGGREGEKDRETDQRIERSHNDPCNGVKQYGV